MEGKEPSEVERSEEAILSFWEAHDIFHKTLAKPSPKGTFVFYEGPPTANGRPGVHHLESRSFKDAVPRYKTMRGYHVPRRAGWDTHGLPVELEVEKELGFKGKKDIEVYGVAEFNKKCRESVMKYIHEWEKFSRRMAYGVDQEKAYFTFNAPFMETAWWVLKQTAEQGRLYKDYKVVPWCARCGTGLSSHELAQGYADVKDLSITAKFELVDEPGTFVLAWTTTPWTLPGNVALAVGKDIAYGLYEKDGEKVIVAVARAEKVLPDWSLLKEMQGHELIGKTYKPLYPFAKDIAKGEELTKFEKAYQIYHADFVTTEDGTGVVHTAVMYGQDDFVLGSSLGLPKVHLVGADGRFVPGTDFLEGRFVKEEDENGKPTLAVDIVDDLTRRGLFFAKENYAHSYPFCWRCKTPLIYYARDSWYVRMQDLQDAMVAENKRVNWEPSHIKDGRMGEWLKGAKDWAISRERYWGTPLPVWESIDGEGRVVIGSIEELKSKVKKSGNTYIMMRHGEATHNLEKRLDSSLAGSHLTEKGRQEVLARIPELKAKKISRVYVSPLARARETANLLTKELGLAEEVIIVDERLREFTFGELEGKTSADFAEVRENLPYDGVITGGESYQDAKNRFGDFLYEVERTHKNETVLVVTHGIGFEALGAVAQASDKETSKKLINELFARPAEVRVLNFIPLPHNEDFELDLHRPYIDEIVLIGAGGQELTRVKDVMDVWFDSGVVPFAQDHYPFENKKAFDKQAYPADYISEAIDQTRGWFYTLMAVGTLLKRGRPYKNVICLGHLLDGEGQKMSKSKGNIINPWEAMDEWGADTLRLWMYSVNQPGDSKSFSEKTVKETARSLSWFENSLKFYELFKDVPHTGGTLQAVDVWMSARTRQTVCRMTEYMDDYKLYDATRELQGYFEDVSQWYVRRIRDRARAGDRVALQTLRHVLHTGARLLAPFSPFLAERVYQVVKYHHDPESVHLSEWPEHFSSILSRLLGDDAKDKNVIASMARVRAIASQGLMERQKVGIKVRQPLERLTVSGVPLAQAYVALIREEVNVEKVEFDEKLEEGTIILDSTLTPALIKKGDVREFLRALADARKQMELEPTDMVLVSVDGTLEALLLGEEMPGVERLSSQEVRGTHTVLLSTGEATFSVSVRTHAT